MRNEYFYPPFFCCNPIEYSRVLGSWNDRSGGGGFGGKRGFPSVLEEWIGLMSQVLLGYELRMFLSPVAKKDHQWFKMQDSEHGNVAQK